MSRIGKKPLPLPKGVTVAAGTGEIRVKGPKGELAMRMDPRVRVDVRDGEAVVVRVGPESDPRARAMYGTTRALLQNMVTGVTQGFTRKLEVHGVGYQARREGDEVVLQVGFSQPARIKVPPGVQVECPQPTQVVVSGMDLQKVGDLAATIRKVRPPEPYKGKGIRYEGEVIKRKAGKAFGSAGS